MLSWFCGLPVSLCQLSGLAQYWILAYFPKVAFGVNLATMPQPNIIHRE